MSTKISSTLAKEADGGVQLNFTLPWETVKQAKAEALAELAKETEVPGFRKGNAPISKVSERVSRMTLVEKTVGRIIPKAIGDAIVANKLKPATYPRIEVLSADEDKDWQGTALTCELPEIVLGNYKKALKGALASGKIWTPGKDTKKEAKEPTREDKQQEVLKILLSTINVTVPKMLIEEEAHSRLSNLLDRLEKLGLTLEGYLSSICKTPETLREDYEKKAKEAITMDLFLNKIADEQNLKVDEKEIEAVITATTADAKTKQRLDTPEKRRLIPPILSRRA